ncbi:hypothetical protein OG705_30315 [Streptomyces sp. NBC_00838]|uniref:hypothetical protein n=1 Tax=Streptomyces sp. NBC_00838 TaxID=2903680 RepID=UPI00386837CB|nr:hypothetical protein OG705_30315 [Streptomyces sp. NBC_00838]
MRAGPNTDLAETLVLLVGRNTAGDWSPDSALNDDMYNRPDGSVDVRKKDPLDALPLFGRRLTAPVTGGNAAEPAVHDAGLN